MSLVQREPLLGLLGAVVMEFVIYAPRAQGFQQIAPDGFRELARMNCDFSRRRLALVVADSRRGDKTCWETPKPKHQRSSKLQNNRAGLIQSFGIWKFLGVWILVFGVSLRLVRHFDHVAVD
jgi:hypothetical protein